jgi:KaiC/GvpD/RAD55 family RecA-like ATPase
LEKNVFETGVSGLDLMLEGGIRWGSTVTIASDLHDRVTLCHQIVENALERDFLIYYLCFKEAPERIRYLMEESNMDVTRYEKERLLRFYAPLETERTGTSRTHASSELHRSSELLKVFNEFITKIMKQVALHIMSGKRVLFVLNNVSALNDLLFEDPRWKDFTYRGSTWLRKLIKVISFQISDMKDLEVAEAIADFCLVMKNIDGIPYIKVTKVSNAGWVPYISTYNKIEIAEDFI